MNIFAKDLNAIYVNCWDVSDVVIVNISLLFLSIAYVVWSGKARGLV